jgi:hypothetical protein
MIITKMIDAFYNDFSCILFFIFTIYFHKKLFVIFDMTWQIRENVHEFQTDC